MPEPVFKASGHLDGFDDMIIVCPECENSHRADHLIEDNTEIEEAESFSNSKVENLIKDHELECPSCGESLADVEVEDFNLMNGDPGYLRPETAQGIFVEFPQLKEYARNQLPFGITQIGKAYRNEISPRKGLVRVREFTQAELEHFIDPEEDEPNLSRVEDVELKLYSRKQQSNKDGEVQRMTVREAVEKRVIESPWIAYYLGIAKKWYRSIGVDMDRFRFRQHQNDELSHYASDCWDAESQVDGDWIEITGFAYRGCYDLKKHNQHSQDSYKLFKEFEKPETVEKNTVNPDMGYLGPKFGNKADKVKSRLEKLAKEKPKAFNQEKVNLKVEGEKVEIPSDKCSFSVEEVKENGQRILPHVVEPSFGIDRIVYTVLAHAYGEDQVDDERRKLLQLKKSVAPTEVAVLPLMDKDGLGKKAQEIAEKLRKKGFSVKYDDSGAIGRRYRRQDEVGTPICITIDYETLEEEPEKVTVRDRDSTEQERRRVSELEQHI